MYKIFKENIKAIKELKKHENIDAASLSLFRMLIQYICISNAEYISHLSKQSSDNAKSVLDIDLNILLKPADGSLVTFMGDSLTLIGKIKNSNIARKYFNEENIQHESLQKWLGTDKSSVKKILEAYVRDRNDSVYGHGISSTNHFLDIEIVEYLIERLKHFLPEYKENKLFFPIIFKLDFIIKTLKLIDGKPVCYREIKKLSNGKLAVKVQIQKTATHKEDFKYECENSLLVIEKQKIYDIYEATDTWSPLIYLPARSTSAEEFTGRKEEITNLLEWFNDIDDSTKCLIYGDGGIGKTTLIVEFIHRILEGNIESEWKPEIITFYTAKRTRWTINGLEILSNNNIGITDVVIHIASLLDVPIDNSWYQLDAEKLINKLKGRFDEQKIKRKNHLLILDNTETMANDDAEIMILAKYVKMLAKNIGRVVLTSRRSEKIEANPIEMTNWSEDEGASYIQKRSKSLNIEQLNKAGLSRIKSVSKQFSNKPLILEVFIQASTEEKSIDEAIAKVKRLQQSDLGKFLFADVWERFTEKEKYFLLLLTRLGVEHDQYLMQLCSEKADLAFSLAEQTLEGSKGICSLNKIDGQLHIVIHSEFMKFCENRKISIDGNELPFENDIKQIERKYIDFLKHINSEVTGIESKAYLSRYAKVARRYFKENNIERAIEYYDLAIEEQPDNVDLIQVYANTLFKLQRYDIALKKITKADNLEPNNSDIIFTKGKIEARLKMTDLAISSLEKASQLGKPLHLCELQKAHAYLLKEIPDLKNAKSSYHEAGKDIPKDTYYAKFNSELEHVNRKIRKMEMQF